MRRLRLMLIAGESSGDMLAAELVKELSAALMTSSGRATADGQPLHAALEPKFFGAGGRHMAAAGVNLELDLTAYAVIGLGDVLRKYMAFRRVFQRLLRLAEQRLPDAIILVDFSGFNRRFAQAVRRRHPRRQGPFQNWHPRIIQFVSPQVWASRAGRVYQMARDYDLLLSIFPFERDWYAQRVPEFKVAYVGHPLLDRYPPNATPAQRPASDAAPLVVLLPGSRPAELQRHLPVLLPAAAQIASAHPARFLMVLPNEYLADMARAFSPSDVAVEIVAGRVADALQAATVAIASTGTVTMECAYFGVPTVTLYKTSWGTYQIGRRIVRVSSLTMPNLLAGAPIFPEFIQEHATSSNIAGAVLEFLRDPARRSQAQAQMRQVIQALGPPGAARRAAQEIAGLLLGQKG